MREWIEIFTEGMANLTLRDARGTLLDSFLGDLVEVGGTIVGRDGKQWTVTKIVPLYSSRTGLNDDYYELTVSAAT